MATVTTWTWTVDRLWTLPQQAGQENVVVNSAFTLTGTDGTHTASIEGNQQFTYTGGEFTPFNSLTQAEVLNWIEAALGEQGISNFKSNVQGQIDSLANPPVSPSSQPLPWASN